ncbi:MAG: Flp pilus assembly protein CpaB [Planctomycetes bacterium]|nr:Flp pilus assembly protein CpaB [Planctomycetota bacterium]
MNAKAIVPLVLGLGVGLVAVKVLVDTLKGARAASKDTEQTMMVRARTDIDISSKITPEMVEVIGTTDRRLIADAERLGSIEEVEGRVAAKAIPQSTLILKSMLAPEGTPEGLQGRIPPGFRGFSVKINEVSAIAYHLQPGNWVDVIVIMNVQAGSRKKETVAEVLLQHVEVIAVGHQTSSEATEDSDKAKRAKSATLLVREEDVPRLHMAAQKGTLTLALRGMDDLVTDKPLIAWGDGLSGTRTEQVAGDTRDTAWGSGGFLGAFLQTAATTPPSQPERPSHQPYGITVYRGSKEGQTVLFEDDGSRTVVGAGSGAATARSPRAGRSGGRQWQRPDPDEQPPVASDENEPTDENAVPPDEGDEPHVGDGEAG